MRFYNWEPLKVSHHLAKFGDHGYIMDLVRHDILEDCVIRVLRDFMRESPLW